MRSITAESDIFFFVVRGGRMEREGDGGVWKGVYGKKRKTTILSLSLSLSSPVCVCVCVVLSLYSIGIYISVLLDNEL